MLLRRHLRHFNPRSREGSDRSQTCLPRSPCNFNPRSCEGSDEELLSLLYLVPDFNPRSREGSDSSPAAELTSAGYFNPRSREGSDSAFPQATYVYSSFQSTLPRGERLWLRENCDKFGVISIHAPARGATTSVLFPANKIEISIHAPARGATAFRSSYYFRVRISIHAPARGATHYHGMSMTDYRIFQSTLPRGERLNFALPATRLHYFNPRSREGSD